MEFKVYLFIILCLFQQARSMEQQNPKNSEEQEISDFSTKQIGATHYNFDKHIKEWLLQLNKSLCVAQTKQERIICMQQIKTLNQVQSELKDADPAQQKIADHIIGEILNAMPEYDIETSRIFCTIIKGVAKGCISQINEWRLDPTGQIKQIVSSITDLMGSIYRITTANQDVPENIKDDPLAHMIYNEIEHFIHGKDNKTLLTELWKKAVNLIESTSFEQKGEILGRIIGDALVFKFVSKIPRLAKNGISNLLKDSEALVTCIADGTFSSTQSINKIQESIASAIESRVGFKGITEMPQNLFLEEYIKLAKEYNKSLTKGGFEEALAAHAGMEEGFFEEVLYRPNEINSSVDFICNNKRIDIKTLNSYVTNKQGITYKNNLDFDDMIKTLKKDLSVGEITVYNTYKLDKTDLNTLMQMVEAATPEYQRHLVHYCFNEQNILDLASKGINLPRMVKDAKTSPIKFAFFQLNADQITPFQMLQEILKVTPEPELAAIIKCFNRTVQDLYTDTTQEKKYTDITSSYPFQEPHHYPRPSDEENEDPISNIPDDIPQSNPHLYQPSNLLLSCLTDIEYQGLTFKKMINKAKEERFKRMVKELSNINYVYVPKTYKEQMELQIQNTEIAYNKISEKVKEIEARRAALAKVSVGTSKSLFIVDQILHFF